jgi:hypothetical protein
MLTSPIVVPPPVGGLGVPEGPPEGGGLLCGGVHGVADGVAVGVGVGLLGVGVGAAPLMFPLNWLGNEINNGRGGNTTGLNCPSWAKARDPTTKSVIIASRFIAV